MVVENNRTEEARRRYVESWNDTMLKIWREKIIMLDAVDTGTLYNSVASLGVTADGKVTSVEIRHAFVEYGFYVDAGTGKEIPIGNPGDVEHDVNRRPKPWFSRKYFASTMNIRDFFADSLALELISIVTALADGNGRRNAMFGPW